MKQLILLIAIIPACKSSDAAKPTVSCDSAPALLASINAANGVGIDLTKPDAQASIDAAKQKLPKTFGFKDCKFSSQGGDSVSFTSFGDGANDLRCQMAGGEAGTKKFRQAAMDFDMDKLKLDVTGKIAEKDGRFELVDCGITPHE